MWQVFAEDVWTAQSDDGELHHSAGMWQSSLWNCMHSVYVCLKAVWGTEISSISLMRETRANATRLVQAPTAGIADFSHTDPNHLDANPVRTHTATHAHTHTAGATAFWPSLQSLTSPFPSSCILQQCFRLAKVCQNTSICNQTSLFS